jgi:hypothetical protein
VDIREIRRGFAYICVGYNELAVILKTTNTRQTMKKTTTILLMTRPEIG